MLEEINNRTWVPGVNCKDIEISVTDAKTVYFINNKKGILCAVIRAEFVRAIEYTGDEEGVLR